MAVPKFLRQYLSVCKWDFPIQGDVTVKLKTVAKLSTKIPPRVQFVCTTLGGEIYNLFSLKVFGILKTFFQKGFKQVRTASATFNVHSYL